MSHRRLKCGEEEGLPGLWRWGAGGGGLNGPTEENIEENGKFVNLKRF